MEFDNELLQVLSMRGWLSFFESMQAGIDVGCIRRLLRQLES